MIKRIEYKDYEIFYLEKYKNLLKLGKNIIDTDIKIFKNFKITKRNYVVGIEFENKKYILKSPRNEHRIPQRKFFTMFKDGESLSTLKNINILIDEYNFDEFVRPLMAIVKRKNRMIVDSYLVMEYVEGAPLEKKDIFTAVEFLKKLHKSKHYHGDANTSNFMMKDGKLKTIDTQGKKYWFGEYRKYYEVFTFSEDLLVLEYELNGIELFNYPKNIWYYLAYFVKYGKKNKYIEKIKKWKKNKRDQGWKI
jgi:heptose II phosphotransferase